MTDLTPDERLERLAAHLDPSLRRRLLQMLDARAGDAARLAEVWDEGWQARTNWIGKIMVPAPVNPYLRAALGGIDEQTGEQRFKAQDRRRVQARLRWQSREQR